MTCRNCGHSLDYHPARFLCHEDGCRCPGWVEKAAGTRKHGLTEYVDECEIGHPVCTCELCQGYCPECEPAVSR